MMVQDVPLTRLPGGGVSSLECPCSFSSLAVIRGLLTAIGGNEPRRRSKHTA